MFPSWWPFGSKTGKRERPRIRLPRFEALPRPRLEVLLIAGAGLLAFIITLAVAASSTAARNRRAAAEALREMQAAEKAPALSAEELSITPEDFLLPPLQPVERREAYAPYRSRLRKWSPELVRKYWVPPRAVATEIIQAINDRNMEQLFQDVP